ncbi:hypothetical protein [Janthinobacterium fluminis]|uniref:Uncharacterized protein n=1 Tax=Janthinobacterium fluminis TaxID=2987524 RepID=A0ABT5K849_9BURK|nr:hypothetical protein [Janthinobacterium fluminis]MDC8760241.1 hypothetical protein [Janthinobacterium fluminis]
METSSVTEIATLAHALRNTVQMDISAVYDSFPLPEGMRDDDCNF